MENDIKDSEEYNLHIENMEMYASGAEDKDISLFQFLYENVGLETDLANELISNWTPPERHTSPVKPSSDTTQKDQKNLPLEFNNTESLFVKILKNSKILSIYIIISSVVGFGNFFFALHQSVQAKALNGFFIFFLSLLLTLSTIGLLSGTFLLLKKRWVWVYYLAALFFGLQIPRVELGTFCYSMSVGFEFFFNFGVNELRVGINFLALAMLIYTATCFESIKESQS